MRIVVVLGLLTCLLTDAYAADDAAPASQPQGLLPIPDYGADFWTRDRLTGDWGGSRTELAGKGIQFELQFQQYAQSVVDGGLDDETEFLSKVSYRLRLDLMQMGVLPGALIDVHAETRYGDTANFETGQLLPSNTAALVPLDYQDVEGGTALALTNLTYTQFLSPRFGVFVGKMDLYESGDPNEFASGRGDTQFMNYNFVYAAPTAIIPESTLGGGLIFMPNQHLTFTTSVLSATDSTSSNGFEEIDGGVWASSLMSQYRVGSGLPGGANATVVYLFDVDFVDFDNFVFSPGGGLTASTKDESWMVVLSAWQYLYTEESGGAGPLDLSNQRPDLQGWGLFGRFAFADNDTNPFETTFSVGVGGRGIFPTRDNDVFGIGFFYTEISSGRIEVEPARTQLGNRLLSRLGGVLRNRIDLDNDEHGFEAFYNFALTPAAKMTFDIQVLDSPVGTIDDSVVLGGRLDLRF